MFVLLLLSACTPAVRNPLPFNKLTAQAAIIPPQEYRIQPGDQLDIKLFYNPELNEQVTVRPDGRISLQLAKEVMAAGLTPAQLNDFLTTTYADQLVNPEVTVMLRSFGGQRLFVDGEVNKAGVVNLVGPMTILQAISAVGGLKESARLNEVLIIRRDAENRAKVATVNLEKALDGSDMSHDILLMPFDIVYVPRSHIADINNWVDDYIRKNIPVPISLGFPVFQ
jgi:protein involved in polysaccharide export with SLBB domain